MFGIVVTVATIYNIVGIVATIGITATFGTFVDYNNAGDIISCVKIYRKK